MKKRILAIFLAALMVAGAFSLFSCKKKEADKSGDSDVSDVVTESEANTESEAASESESATESEATSESQSAEDSEDDEEDTDDSYLSFDVEDDLDYGGKQFTILTWDKTNEFGDSTLSEKTVVSQALLTRDSYLEQYLNVKLNIIYEQGDWTNAPDFADKVYTNVMSTTGSYDLICAYSMVPSILTPKGVLYDMGSAYFADGSENFVDYTKAWWPEFFVDSLKMGDKIYSVSGDASTNLLYNLSIVMMDYNELDKHHIDPKTIYKAVDDGEWTLEYWLELSKGISENRGDSAWDMNDYYAISGVGRIPYSSFYFSTGNKLVENKNGRFVVSEDIESAKAIDVFERVYEAMYTEHTVRNTNDGEIVLISNGNCVFEMGTTQQLGGITEVADGDIGLVPFPKYDSGDTPYITLVQNTHSHFCIPTNVADPSISAAVLETLGYASYDVVTPVVYENVMKLRYSKDPDSSRMFDIIRAGAITDAGILNYFVFVANGCPDPLSMFRNLIHDAEDSTVWVSNFKNRYESGMNKTLNELNEFYLG